jgi:effector-binding domain-containing protein
VPAPRAAILRDAGSVRHHGPIANIDLAYGELSAYVITHEIGVQGPLRENYVRGFLDTEDPQAWETEIGWPIFRSDTHAPEPHPG